MKDLGNFRVHLSRGSRYILIQDFPMSDRMPKVTVEKNPLHVQIGAIQNRSPKSRTKTPKLGVIVGNQYNLKKASVHIAM